MSKKMDEPILTPKELLAYRRVTRSLEDFSIPETVIFIPQKSLAEYIVRRYSVKRIKGFLGEFYLLKKSKGRIAISTGFGIGSPVIAGLTDEFTALGVKRFGLIGLAGGLQDDLWTGSIILPAGAIRGEGVSRHYLPPAEIVETSMEMTEFISRALLERSIQHSRGIAWTTDAPFRELRKDVLAYQERGVLAVDMETAGMLAVAKSYDIPAFVVFAIADILAGGIWRMAKDLRKAQYNLRLIFDVIFDILMG